MDQLNSFLNATNGLWAALAALIAVVGLPLLATQTLSAVRAARMSPDLFRAELRRAMTNLHSVQTMGEIWLRDDVEFPTRLRDVASGKEITDGVEVVRATIAEGTSIRIVGDGGRGKSTFAWRIRRSSLSSGDGPLFEVVAARELTRLDRKPVVEGASALMAKRYPGFRRSQFEGAFARLEIILIIDGLDELPTTTRRDLLDAVQKVRPTMPTVVVARQFDSASPDQPPILSGADRILEVLPIGEDTALEHISTVTAWGSRVAAFPEVVRQALRNPLLLKVLLASAPTNVAPNDIVTATYPDRAIWERFVGSRLQGVSGRQRASSLRLLSLLGISSLRDGRQISLRAIGTHEALPLAAWIAILPAVVLVGYPEYSVHFVAYVWVIIGCALGVIPLERFSEWLFRNREGAPWGFIWFMTLAASAIAVHLTLNWLDNWRVEGTLPLLPPELLSFPTDLSAVWSVIVTGFIGAVALLRSYDDVEDGALLAFTPKVVLRFIDPIVLRVGLCTALVYAALFADLGVAEFTQPALWMLAMITMVPLVWWALAILAASAFTRIPPWRLRTTIGDLAHVGLLMRSRGEFRLPHDDVAVAVARIAILNDKTPTRIHGFLPTWIGTRIISQETYSESYDLASALMPHISRRRTEGGRMWGAVWEERPTGDLKRAERLWTKLWRSTNEVRRLVARARVRHMLGKHREADFDLDYAMAATGRTYDDNSRIVRVLVLRGRFQDALRFVDTELPNPADRFAWEYLRHDTHAAHADPDGAHLRALREQAKRAAWIIPDVAAHEWERSSARAAWRTLTAAPASVRSGEDVSYWSLRCALALQLGYTAEARIAALEIQRMADWSLVPELALECHALIGAVLKEPLGIKLARDLVHRDVRIGGRPHLTSLLTKIEGLQYPAVAHHEETITTTAPIGTRSRRRPR